MNYFDMDGDVAFLTACDLCKSTILLLGLSLMKWSDSLRIFVRLPNKSTLILCSSCVAFVLTLFFRLCHLYDLVLLYVALFSILIEPLQSYLLSGHFESTCLMDSGSITGCVLSLCTVSEIAPFKRVTNLGKVWVIIREETSSRNFEGLENLSVLLVTLILVLLVLIHRSPEKLAIQRRTPAKRP